jgi:hypothetical protein
VFSFYSSFVGLIFSETLYSMLLVYMIHYKSKLFPIVDPMTRHLRIENSHTQIALFSKRIRQHVQQMPFFENTEILRRDVQVLDHILMEIKTHFILNLPRPKITTANACATRPPKTVGIYGGGEEDAACPLPAFWYLHAVQWETTYCRVYITYVIIRNV